MSMNDRAVESIVDLLGAAGKDRLHVLAMNWPALGAALGDLLEEYNRHIPGPLRHARKVIREERPGHAS